MMRKSQSRNDPAFHKTCKGPGARINLACQRIYIRLKWLEEVEVEGGEGDRAILHGALVGRKEFRFYTMCNKNPQEGLNRELV